MSIHFSRSVRRLEADSARQSLILLVIILSVVAGWATWFVVARVSVYASTSSARLEVDQENHPVDATTAGRVTLTHLSPGQRVRAGDILLELDANVERLAQSEALARLAPTQKQQQSLHDELRAEETALQVERRSAQAAVGEADAKTQEAVSASEFAAEEAKRLADLQHRGLVSDLEALRGRKAADERNSEVRAAEFAATRITRDLDAREQNRLARIARLQNEIAAIDAGRSEAVAASERLEYEIDQRQVRAPIGGIVAEIAPIKIGAMVQPGDRLCTIVPDGVLKVIAMFTPSNALGRIRDGQSARVRLAGFPWTQFGMPHASVSHVSGEVRDGQVRVELALTEQAAPLIPLQHGLPAEVDVEIEKISPMAMVLRSIGGHLRVSAAAPRSTGIQ